MSACETGVGPPPVWPLCKMEGEAREGERGHGRDAIPRFDGSSDARVWLMLFEESAEVRRERDRMWRQKYMWPRRVMAYLEGAATAWVGSVAGMLTLPEEVGRQVKVWDEEVHAAEVSASSAEQKAALAGLRARNSRLVADATDKFWEDFRRAFIARFAPQRSMGDAMVDLARAVKKRGESDRAFAERLVGMVRDVPAVDVTWNAIAKMFILKQSESLRIHFARAQTECHTAAEFNALVAELEALTRGSDLIATGAAAVAASEVGAAGRGARSCFRCGQPGHLARDCGGQKGGAGTGGGAAVAMPGPPQFRGLPPAQSTRSHGPADPTLSRGLHAMSGPVPGGPTGGAGPARRAGPPQASQKPAAPWTCLRCGKVGHKASRCRATVEEADAFQAQSTVAALGVEDREEEADLVAEIEDLELGEESGQGQE